MALRPSRRLAALVVAVAFALAGCDISVGNLAGRATEEWTHHYSLSPGGEIRIANTNGRVDIEGVDGSDVEVRPSSGGVTVSLPDSAKADLSASCTNGGISVSRDLKVDASEQSRRRFEGKMNGGGTAIDLQTTNGGIRVRPRATAENPNTSPQTRARELHKLKSWRERG